MSDPTIVVATDLSPAAERAFGPAAALARCLGARVVLLHVVPDAPAALGVHAPPLRSASAESDVAAAKQRLAEFAKAFPDGIPVGCEVIVARDFDAAITDFAHKTDARYLVVTTHGRTGVRRLVLGSVAEGVLRRSRVPVVVVPLGQES
ncbi:MAG TPA: universal stress protein [Planctomycetota bacterium]|nr:universal stress protein [Planctomycetota bacterium]